MPSSQASQPALSHWVEGRVIDADDRPVAGALVRPQWARKGEVKTDVDGFFTLDAPETYLRPIEASHGQTSARENCKGESLCILRLQPTTALTVRVKDAASGAPIIGALAVLDGSQNMRVKSDQQGHALLDADRTSRDVEVSAPDFVAAHQSFRLNQSSATIQVLLTRGATVSGQVVDGNNVPTADVPVSARLLSDSQSHEQYIAHTDAQGNWSSEALAQGLYAFFSESSELGIEKSSSIRAEARSPVKNVRIEFKKTGNISGNVIAESPITNGGVKAYLLEKGAPSAPVATAKLARSGKFSLAIPASSASYLVQVAAHGLQGSAFCRAVSWEDCDISLSPHHASEYPAERSETSAPPSRTLTGCVVDSRGCAVPGARVRAIAQPISRRVSQRYIDIFGKYKRPSGLADRKGNFSLVGVPPGNWALYAELPMSTSILAPPDHRFLRPINQETNNYVVALPEGGALRGKVMFSDGSAPSALNFFQSITGSIDLKQQSYARDGTFLIKTSQAGFFRAQIHGPDFLSKTVTSKIGPAETVDLGTITVERGKTVMGRILSPAGTPLADVAIFGDTSLDGPRETVGYQTRSTITDANGSFVLNALRENELSIDHPRWGRAIVVATAAGKNDIVLHPSASLCGVARFADKPASGIGLRPWLSPTLKDRAIVTGEDGAFCFDNLMPGEYTISRTPLEQTHAEAEEPHPFATRGYRTPSPAALLKIQLQPGESATHDLVLPNGPE